MDPISPKLASRLRRITTGGRLIPEIDGFRFLAILIVLIDHCALQIAHARDIGWPAILSLPGGGLRGVYLFFAISGFILGLPFARRHLSSGTPPAGNFSYARYLKRRVTRLEPPYIITLCARALLLTWFMQASLHTLWPHFVASLLYVHNLVFASMSPVSPPTWSLEVEVQFYLLAPLLAQVFRIRSVALRRMLLVGGTLLASFIAWYWDASMPRVNLSLLGNLQYFAAGLLICDLYVTRWLESVPSWAWDIVGALSGCALLWDSSAVTSLLFPFGTVLLYLAGLRGVWVRRVFANPLISIAGGMCYSVYLTHGTVLAFLARFVPAHGFPGWPPALQSTALLIVAVLAAYAVGTVVFLLLERPCMDPSWPSKLGHLLFGRRRQAATAQ